MPQIITKERKLRLFGPHETECNLFELRSVRGEARPLEGGWVIEKRKHVFALDIKYKLQVHARVKNARRARRFQNLADEWESETRHIASSKKIALHPLVREIVGMGPSVIPLILRRMRQHPWFWFHALMELTRATEDPVTASMRGDMQRMTEAWIKWGEDRGII